MKISKAIVHDNCQECLQKINSFVVKIRGQNPNLVDNLKFLEIKVHSTRSVDQDGGVKPLFVFSHNNHVYGFFNQAILVALATSQATNFARGTIVLSRESLLMRTNNKNDSGKKTSHPSMSVNNALVSNPNHKTKLPVTPTNLIMGFAKQNYDLNRKFNSLEEKLLAQNGYWAKGIIHSKRLSKKIILTIIAATLFLSAGLGVGVWQTISHLSNSNNTDVNQNSDTDHFDLSTLNNIFTVPT